MNILTIQSSVTLGHVGNSVAVPALQALGHDAWPIDTVAFSNHPGHGEFRGRVASAAEIADLAAGLGDRGALAVCDAVLTGYLGSVEQGPAVLDAVTAVKAVNPRALYALDPVIGDHGPVGGRVYVKPGVAEFLRDRALGAADLVFPNAFELEFLAGAPARDTAATLAAIRRLRPRLRGGARGDGPLVVVTGLTPADQPPDTLSVIGVDGRGAWRIAHPRLDHPAHGAGDLFAALLLGRLLNGEAASTAAALAASAVHAVIARTAAAASKDLLLVAARAELTAPRRRFAAEPLG